MNGRWCIHFFSGGTRLKSDRAPRRRVSRRGCRLSIPRAAWVACKAEFPWRPPHKGPPQSVSLLSRHDVLHGAINVNLELRETSIVHPPLPNTSCQFPTGFVLTQGFGGLGVYSGRGNGHRHADAFLLSNARADGFDGVAGREQHCLVCWRRRRHCEHLNDLSVCTGSGSGSDASRGDTEYHLGSVTAPPRCRFVPGDTGSSFFVGDSKTRRCCWLFG